MKAQRIVNTIVNLFCLAMFLLPLAAIIHHYGESVDREREFHKQQQEYHAYMTKQIREYNEMKKRAAK